MKPIKKYAAVILRSKLLLVVRKKGTDIFISPGGKPDMGETKLQCLSRELEEELNIKLITSAPLGQFSHKSAFEDSLVDITADYAEYSGTPEATSEIAEIAWIDLSYQKLGMSIGSIFAEEVIPYLGSKELIRSKSPKINPELKTLLAFDIDGTIAFDGTVEKPVAEAIIQAKNNPKCDVVFATSRAPRGVRKALSHLADNTTFVCCNGAVIMTGDQTHVVSVIPSQLVRDIILMLDEKNIAYFIEYGNHFTHSGALESYPEMQGYDDASTLDKSTADWERRVAKISCRSQDIKDKISPLLSLSQELSFHFHGNDTVEFTRSSTNKFNALKSLDRSHSHNLIAFGNDENDFEMLANAEQGFVIGNNLQGIDKCGNVHRIKQNANEVAEQILAVLKK